MSLASSERVLPADQASCQSCESCHVSDLSNKGGGEEDILGCQISVDDLRLPIVEVNQSTGHIL